ncbi:D-alanine--D-alanine ligase family protein [Neomicrococcus lactis]|uniref:D-alanine--D-alanine ligase n=1 Tax=Neomicrococcus lactis TaxID=732241 RepID=A0A7W8YA76_9MICC|nr:D-alanine--D-alanine ligase family protein [Neomicrococcus lactis]MBB5597505.1 D-alanine-D-alanine ligase [Neomicrococcus lactis]
MTTASTRVLLLFGGRSSEHSVSCVTAAGVLRAIDRERFDVIPVGITPDGEWTRVDSNPDEWTLRGTTMPVVPHSGESIRLSKVGKHFEVLSDQLDENHENVVSTTSLGTVDVVFPLLHGPYGEDGTLQGQLELLDIPYVGSGVAASAIGMDKHFMKVAFEAAGLEVGPYEVITNKQWLRSPEEALDRLDELEYPLFVKPSRAGSSVGITRVESKEQLTAAIEEARRFDPKVVVEQGIVGREIECGVLEGRGSDHARASLPGEIVVEAGAHSFYDFEAKYVDGAAAKLSCPAELTEEATKSLQELAVKAFDAVDGEGLGRVDFFYTPDGRWVINEINTMPGFTPVSMYPQMWDKTGMSYPELITELIDLALNRKLGLR